MKSKTAQALEKVYQSIDVNTNLLCGEASCEDCIASQKITITMWGVPDPPKEFTLSACALIQQVRGGLFRILTTDTKNHKCPTCGAKEYNVNRS